MTPREDHATSTVEAAAAFERHRGERYGPWDDDTPTQTEARADQSAYDDQPRSKQ